MSALHYFWLRFFFVAGIVVFFLVVRFVCTLDRISEEDSRRIESRKGGPEEAGCEDAAEEWREKIS